MMIATEVSTKKARWLPTFRTSSRSVSKPMTIEGTSGVFDLPCTFAMAEANGSRPSRPIVKIIRMPPACTARRSEEHTSELQSRLHLVCRLLLEKKKKNKKQKKSESYVLEEARDEVGLLRHQVQI